MEYLEYLITHPIEAFFFVLLQFFIVMWLHNRYHSTYLHILLSIWFIPQDIAVNWVLFTIIGLEIPQEWTVTSRMKRWKKLNVNHPLGAWRFNVADTLCRVLNKAELGHC